MNDVFNGILVKGNMLGVTMYSGSGAGKLPTASAVVAVAVFAVMVYPLRRLSDSAQSV